MDCECLVKQTDHKMINILSPLKSVFLLAKEYSSFIGRKQVSGYIEYVDTLRAAGWALNRSGEPVELYVQLAGEVYKPKDIHWRERPDVRETFPSRSKAPGFILEFPPELARKLSVRPEAMRAIEVLANNEPIRVAKQLELHVIEFGLDATDDAAIPPAQWIDDQASPERVQRQLAEELSAPLPSWVDDLPGLKGVFPEAAEIFAAGRYLEHLNREGPYLVQPVLEVLRQYMQLPDERWSVPDPHPLFDVDYYAAQVSPKPPELSPLIHYLTLGWKSGLKPHPLFDVEHYLKQSGALDCPPLVHYLREGWRQGFTPHRLFCPEYYLKSARLENPVEAPLVTYLRGAAAGEPHYFFDSEHYRRFQGFLNGDSILMRYVEFSEPKPLPKMAELGDTNPLLHYIEVGSKRGWSPHFLFHHEWYLRQRQPLAAQQPPPAEQDLLLDFLEVGVRHRLSPSPLVDVDHYVAQTGLDASEDWLRHYFLKADKDLVSFSPGFDARYYCGLAPASLEMDSPLRHLLSTPAEQRKNIAAAFDPVYYLSIHSDVERAKLCPFVHFLAFGARENRHPNQLISESYVASHLVSDPQDLAQPMFGYSRTAASQRLRLLFVSHEASRSGAPAIILSLVRAFAEHANAECITILDRGGDLLADFKRHSHVMLMSKSVHEVGPRAEMHDKDIETLMQLLADNPPVVAFVNSAESRHIGERLVRYGIPVISLVHETPSYYPPEEFDRIYRFSKRVVFPSSYIDQKAREHCPYPDGLAVVRGQGLLRRGFGRSDRTQARRSILRELGLGGDAILVLGCGSVNFRKGADVFLSAAELLGRRLKDNPAHRPVFFCWIGDGPDLNEIRKEMEQSKLHHLVQFVGARPDVERYFVAGDIFALPSRSDPFPCVVHEAMAAGLPIVGFEGGGGAPELYGDGAGVTVSLGDVAAMVEAIEVLVFDDDRRHRMSEAARRIIAERGSNEAYFADIKRLASEVTAIDLDRELGARPTRYGRKVFCLAPDWGLSGVNSFAEALVNGLNARGFSAEILFTRGRFTYWQPDSDGRIPVPEAPWSRLEPEVNSAAAIWQELQSFLKAEAPCVIIPNYDYVASAITPVLDSSVGVLGVLHSDDVEHYEHVYRLGQYWNRIIPVSEQIERRALELNPAFRSRTKVIRCGISPMSELDIEAKAPSPDQPIQLVYTGRLETYQKAIRRYATLADRLASLGIRARLVMCGDGSEFAALKSAMGGHIRAGRAELTGRVSPLKIREILRNSHVFVLLSDFEGLPISLLEAMDAGCVPITYQMESGIPEVIRSGENGFIVPHGDLVSVVDAVAGLHSDAQKWCRMAQAARRTIRELKLTQDDMSESYSSVIAEIFNEIESGAYRRPPSLAFRAKIEGVLPPAALCDPHAPISI